MTSPAETKRIVCLANSFKHGGRCVAGKESLPDGQFGKWIRPVSEKGEIPENKIRYVVGGAPRLLDVIDVPVIEARPANHQRENWLIDSTRRWKFVRRVHPNMLEPLRLEDAFESLWVNSYSSSTGLNNRVPESSTSNIRDSLRLIWTDNLNLSVSEHFGKRIVQGGFRYLGVDYSLRVTDPVITGQCMEKPVGDYTIGGRYVTVSLGGVFDDGNCYKLIAAIMDPREVGAP